MFENKRLVGALVLGKGFNKKELKAILKSTVLGKVDVNQFKTDLLREDFNYNSIFNKKE